MLSTSLSVLPMCDPPRPIIDTCTPVLPSSRVGSVPAAEDAARGCAESWQATAAVAAASVQTNSLLELLCILRLGATGMPAPHTVIEASAHAAGVCRSPAPGRRAWASATPWQGRAQRSGAPQLSAACLPRRRKLQLDYCSVRIGSELRHPLAIIGGGRQRQWLRAGPRELAFRHSPHVRHGGERRLRKVIRTGSEPRSDRRPARAAVDQRRRARGVVRARMRIRRELERSRIRIGREFARRALHRRRRVPRPGEGLHAPEQHPATHDTSFCSKTMAAQFPGPDPPAARRNHCAFCHCRAPLTRPDGAHDAIGAEGSAW